jgi:hypothetical protein
MYHIKFKKKSKSIIFSCPEITQATNKFNKLIPDSKKNSDNNN